jgi:hypothetical protein
MNSILKTTKFVVENSSFVKINDERLIAFAQSFDHGKATHWLSSAPFDFSHFNDNQKLRFLFLFNALSFCYWGEPKWTVEYQGKQYDGAWGMIVALGKATHAGVPLLDFQHCRNFDESTLGQLLEGNTEIPLLRERTKIINEIGSVMVTNFNSDAANVVKSADSDAQKLLAVILENFPSFRDTSVYQEREVCFQKRAQLLVADIFQIFGGKGYGDLRNIDTLTACADYKLPQILRKLGILKYTSELGAIVDNKIELMHSSPEEVELRANTIWAVELITKEVKKRNSNILPIEVNDHLWLATQEKFPDDKPYHRTRTTAY